MASCDRSKHSRHRARFLVGCAVLGLILAGCSPPWSSSSAAGAIHLSYRNPVFDRDFPDPMVLRDGPHDYWAYSTWTSWQLHRQGAFPILHSRDLVHWKYVDDALQAVPEWAAGTDDLWAPDVLRHGKTYYLYYTGLGVKGLGAPMDTHCIGVATGRSPKGPFSTRDVIGCGDATGTGYIDPDLFIDTNGKAYLYVSVDNPHHSISAIPMKPDLLHAAGKRVELVDVDQRWESGPIFSTVEGPYCIKRGKTYYLFFSGNAYEGSYAMGYATAVSPLGPFTAYRHNPILRGTNQVKGPGGGSIVRGPDGRLWMVYHAWSGPEGYARGGERTMWIDPIVWHAAVPGVHPTFHGKGAH